jgi:hypothetical protein
MHGKKNSAFTKRIEILQNEFPHFSANKKFVVKKNRVAKKFRLYKTH